MFKLTDGSQIEIKYDQLVPASTTPEEMAEALANAAEVSSIDEVKMLIESEWNKDWPAKISGKYRRDGENLFIHGTRMGEPIVLELPKLMRQKF